MIANYKSFKGKAKKGVIGALVRNFNNNSCSGFATAGKNSSFVSIRASSHADVTETRVAEAGAFLLLFTVLT